MGDAVGSVSSGGRRREGRGWVVGVVVAVGLVAVLGIGSGAFLRKGSPVRSAVIKMVDGMTWRMRRTAGVNSARQTGAFTIANGLSDNFCGVAEGTIRLDFDKGLPTGRKVMATHVAEVSENGIVSVFVDVAGSKRIYPFRKVEIVGYPEWQLFPATVKDLRAGDCVLLFGVEKDQPVDVRGVR